MRPASLVGRSEMMSWRMASGRSPTRMRGAPARSAPPPPLPADRRTGGGSCLRRRDLSPPDPAPAGLGSVAGGGEKPPGCAASWASGAPEGPDDHLRLGRGAMPGGYRCRGTEGKRGVAAAVWPLAQWPMPQISLSLYMIRSGAAALSVLRQCTTYSLQATVP